MKNKKGVSIGRIILYLLFLTLVVFFVWTLYLTFKSIKKEKITSDIQTNSSLRLVNVNNDSVVNLYDNSSFPFVNRNNVNVSVSDRGFTGCYIALNPGTYTLTVPSGFTDTYCYGFMVADIPTFAIGGHIIYEMPSYSTSSSLSLTLNQSGYWGFYVKRIDNANFSASLLNSMNFMFNEGSSADFVSYDSNFVNVCNYIDNAYFDSVGYFAYSGNSYIMTGGFLPYSNLVYQNGYLDSTNKTTFSKDIINSNDLRIGENIESLYTSIDNSSFSGSYNGFNFTKTYNDTLKVIQVFYELSSPIPVTYFNFTLNGSDLLSNNDCICILGIDNEQRLSIHFDNTQKFTSQLILNAAPSANYIYYFGFTIFAADTSSSNPLPIQNKSWSTYKNFCNFHLIFDNYYGSSNLLDAYNDGFRAGQAAADEGLVNNNTELQNQIDSLNTRIDELNSRIISQSLVIDSLNNQLQEASNNFKGLFFTFADIPFRTVSNSLGFEFFGVNLFKFFVGIITALGIVWLIKKII